MTEDVALAALMLPFDDGTLARAPGALFLGARPGAALDPRAWPGLRCVQRFRPEYDALRAAGFDAVPEPPAAERAPLVLALTPRQRDAARALLADAVARARGGRVVVAVRNDEGARSVESDLAALAGPLSVRSKHKCRVAWSAPIAAETADAATAHPWGALDAVRTLDDGTVTRPGVFAWDRLDAGTALLAAHLPGDLHGRAVDLGAGHGLLSRALLARCAGIAALDLFEADARALALAPRNLEAHAARVALGFHWRDVTAGLDGSCDVVVCNPPFHAQARDPRPDIGLRFLEVAADVLRPGGRLWLVANRQLPYEATLASRFTSFRAVAQDGVYKVVEAMR